jgi:protein TonB
MMLTSLTVPPSAPTSSASPPPPEVVHVVHVQSEMMNNQLVAPTKIPQRHQAVHEKEAPPQLRASAWPVWKAWAAEWRRNRQRVWKRQQRSQGEGRGAQEGQHFRRCCNRACCCKRRPDFIRPLPRPPAFRHGGAAGDHLQDRDHRKSSRVISGNAMLQQSALDAVRSWRYRPYLLNGDPGRG